MGKLFGRKKKGKPDASRAAGAGDSDSDISLMTDSDLEEERQALRATLSKAITTSGPLTAGADPFDQASLWAEVGRWVARSWLIAAQTASLWHSSLAAACRCRRLLKRAAATRPLACLPPHQVDRDELERIAINIARNAVPPSGDSEDAAARLNISAAVLEKAEENDTADPLGYGRIDPRLLTLVGVHDHV